MHGVLSWFNFNRLAHIHWPISPTHVTSFCTLLSTAEDTATSCLPVVGRHNLCDWPWSAFVDADSLYFEILYLHVLIRCSLALTMYDAEWLYAATTLCEWCQQCHKPAVWCWMTVRCYYTVWMMPAVSQTCSGMLLSSSSSPCNSCRVFFFSSRILCTSDNVSRNSSVSVNNNIISAMRKIHFTNHIHEVK